jgi:hypothetical protein
VLRLFAGREFSLYQILVVRVISRWERLS